MDRLVNHLFVFEGEGAIRDYPGNYTQYREWQKDQESLPQPEVKVAAAPPAAPAAQKVKKKLSFKEQHEFDTLEKEIAQLDKERKNITEQLSSAQMPYDELQKLTERIGELNKTIDTKEMRWLELSDEG
jgi:ATP-binding cassette subfamily F protein uup